MLTMSGRTVPGLDESGAPVAPDFPCVKGIPQLVREKSCSSDLARFRQSVQSMESAPTPQLLLRLESTVDPLRLWALHLQLERRQIPPCLRWPPRADSEQMLFLSVLADLRWICFRLPPRRPKFRGWRGLYSHTPGTPAWHSVAHRQLSWIMQRGYSLAHHCSKGLALTDSERQHLLMLPTNAMAAERRQLVGSAFKSVRESLLSDAMAYPDKSGRRSAPDVASRRAAIWRTYLLSHRSKVLTAERLALIGCASMSRQALTKQIEAIERALCG